MPRVKKAATDVTMYHMLVDSSDGTPETAYTFTNLDLQYTRDRQAESVKVDATELTTVSDAHADNQGKEVNATSSPGLYRVDWPDAAFSDNAAVDKVQLVVSGTGLHPSVIEVELEKYDVSDVYELVSDVDSELTVVLTGVNAARSTIDSDSVLYLADHDKTQSDIGDLSTKQDSDMVILGSDIQTVSDKLDTIDAAIDSDSVLYLADHDKTQSDIADLSTKVDSDSLLYVSDLSDIISDLTLTKLSDLATAASITTLSTKVDSDSTLYLADHDKTQSDIGDISTKLDSDALLHQSDLSDIKSELVIVHSDTLAIEAAGGALTVAQASDLAAIESDLKKTPLSDTSAKIDSDSLLYLSDLSDIISDLTVTKLSDLATAASITTLSTKVDSDSTLYLADHDKTQSDIADLSTKVDSDAVLADADHDKTQSDIAAVSTKLDSDALLHQSDLSDIKSELVVVHSDTLAIEAAGGALTAGQASDLAAIESDLKKTPLSDLDAAIDSDSTLYLADHDKTQSDIADLSTKVASDVLALETALDSDFLAVETKINSDAVLADADHDKTQSDVALLSTKVDSDAVLADADHDKTQSDVADLSTKVDSDAVLEAADHDKTQSDLVAVWTTALTESYAAHEAEGTPAQILYTIQQALTEFDIVSTALTIRKLDGTTQAAVLTLDSATVPTKANRTT